MKKFWSAVIVALLMISFTACDSPTNPKPASVSLEEARSLVQETGSVIGIAIEIAEVVASEGDLEGIPEVIEYEVADDGDNKIVTITYPDFELAYYDYEIEEMVYIGYTINGTFTIVIIAVGEGYKFDITGSFVVSGKAEYNVSVRLLFDSLEEEVTSGAVTINGTVFDIFDLIPASPEPM